MKYKKKLFLHEDYNINKNCVLEIMSERIKDDSFKHKIAQL